MYKHRVKHTMTNGIETRVDTKETKNLLRTAEMKTLRTFTGRSLHDRIRNEHIRQQCGVNDVVKWRRQTRQYWYQHIKRLNLSGTNWA